MKDLISKILETDPTKRYTMDDIRRHPWYRQIEVPQSPHKMVPTTVDELHPGKQTTHHAYTQTHSNTLNSHPCVLLAPPQLCFNALRTWGWTPRLLPSLWLATHTTMPQPHTTLWKHACSKKAAWGEAARKLPLLQQLSVVEGQSHRQGADGVLQLVPARGPQVLPQEASSLAIATLMRCEDAPQVALQPTSLAP